MSNLDVASTLVKANAFADAGNISEAKVLFSKLCEVDSGNPEVWLMMGALHGETGMLEDAKLCLSTAVELSPDYPEAFLTLAHLNKADNALDDSYVNVKKAVEIDPDYDEAWVFLAAMCCELNLFQEAERASQEAIKRWPENVQAHVSLSTALCYLSRENEAEPVIRHAISLGGEYLVTLNALLGRVLLGKGEFDEAEALIKSALVQKPDDIPLLLNMANIYLGQKNYKKCEVEFNKVIQIDPQSGDAWTGLGLLYQAIYDHKQSEECYRKAISINPQGIPQAYNLALLQEINGEFDDAISILKNIHQQQPDQLDVIGALASVLEKNASYDEAISLLDLALTYSEKSVRVALVYQRLCKKMDKCENAAQYICDVLDAAALKPDDAASLNFALGNIYDQLKEYDNAFQYYKNANEVSKQDYDPDGYTAYIEEMISVFSNENIQKMPDSSNTSAQPVFIVGMPRSGTSLVEQILSSHSEVFAAGELRNIIELSAKTVKSDDKGGVYPTSMKTVTKDIVSSLSDDYLNEINALSDGAARVTDKMPHNFQHIGLIRTLFPNAKIIHCVRDAKDTCLSCYFQNFYGHHPYTFDLSYLGHHYKDYQRLMKHWKSLEIPMLEICYEDMVDDQEKWSRKLVEYCDLQWEDQCLSFYKNKRATRTASYDQVRQPVYKTSTARWKNYESHIAPLLEVLDEV